ncbi:TPA: glycoside hydrolase family 1 protein [Candidatus Saccharibacteria bacterium]|nr:glycoside hydrolase family 1 protein [Candidatus Saccharibacteria bacterium]HIO87250.1 glycoside hydrolase family 1 protein [Candidatus Saccharibacteria bacterium]
MSKKLKFPDGFLWGAATSAHQIEGGQHNDWTEWEPTVSKRLAREAPARLKELVYNWADVRDEAKDPNNYISAKATDHFTRYKEDIKNLSKLGLNSFAFSIEWSRIEPEPGIFNHEAMQHYVDVVDTCLEHGVAPVITLHHFTNPVWFAGWHERHAPTAFEKYAQYVFDAIGAKAKYWITINEPSAVIFMRYLKGDVWPAWPKAENNIFRALFAYRNMVRAHRRSYNYMKAQKPSVKVGFVHGWVEFINKGKVVSKLLTQFISWINNKAIHRPIHKHIDFVALHYYLAADVKVGLSWPSKWVSQYGQHSQLKTQKGWQVYPEGIQTAISSLHSHYGLPIFVTENGISDSSDTYRQQFIAQHLKHIHGAIESGAEVTGYLYWSLLDNFEWSEGYWEKFGLFAVDPKTKERSARGSAKWYGQVAKNNFLEIDS